MANKDGLAKNLDVVGGEIDTLKTRLRTAWIVSWSEFQAADWIYPKLHKWVNIRTELFRAITPVFPRTLAYLSLIPFEGQGLAWVLWVMLQGAACGC